MSYRQMPAVLLQRAMTLDPRPKAANMIYKKCGGLGHLGIPYSADIILIIDTVFDDHQSLFRTIAIRYSIQMNKLMFSFSKSFPVRARTLELHTFAVGGIYIRCHILYKFLSKATFFIRHLEIFAHFAPHTFFVLYLYITLCIVFTYLLFQKNRAKCWKLAKNLSSIPQYTTAWLRM